MVQSKQGSPPNKCKSEYSGFHPPSSQWTPDRIDPSTISPLQFFNRYIKSRTPVILTQFPQEFKDFALDWNAIKTKAGQAVVKVEDQDVHSKQFGSGQIRRTMTIEELDEQLLLGQHYLTTQYHTKEDEEVLSPNLSRIQEYCQPPLTSMINDFPHRPQILGHLAPQQVNVWVGYQHGSPKSSGLHHDFHDNLYLLISGHKKFNLFSPKDTELMYTYGQPEKVWPNGLIQYGPGTRGDGAFMDQIAGWKVEKAEAELEALENEGKDTTEAEERVEAAMDELMKYQSLHLSDAEDDEEEEDSDAEVELGTKRKGLLQGSQSNTSKKSQKDSSDERMEPNSFSRIDVQTLRSNTPSQKFPLLAKATQTQVELAQGEALYLPTGWFHEVTSSCSDGKEGLHMAFNYWMCPPTTDDFENPYEDTYWEENWNEVTRLIDAMGSK